MKKIEDIRRENLQRIRAKLGSVQDLAEKIGKSQSQVSQWLNASAHSSSGKPRTISSASCREIEKALGLADGWMDAEQDGTQTAPQSPSVDALRAVLNEASAEARLLAVYRLSNSAQRESIDSAVDMVVAELDIITLLSGTK